MTTRHPFNWKRMASGARWAAEGCRYQVCLNDSGRSFRVMRQTQDGYLQPVSAYLRLRRLDLAQDVAAALHERDERD